MEKSLQRVRAARAVTSGPADAEYRTQTLGFVAAVVILLLAGTPLCMLPGVFLSHDVIPKVVATLCGSALLLLLFPRWASGIERVWATSAGRRFLILVAAQCASLMISTAASTRPGLSLAGTVWRRFGAVEQIAILVIALAAAAITAREDRWLTSLFRGISIGGAVAALYGICQYFGFDPFLDPKLYTVAYLGGIVRPPSTMGHSIYFAAWLVPVAVISVAAAFSEAKSPWKALHACTAALAAIAIVLSGTRGALIALIVAAIFLAVRIGGQPGSGFRVQFSMAAAGIVLVIAAIAISPLGSGIRHRFAQWREDPGGPRLSIWREAPAIVFGNFVLGTGPETFGEEFRQIESEALSRAYPDFYNETPHNVFLDAACAQGLPGLLILAGLFGVGIFGRRDRLSVTNTALQAAVLGILVSSFFASFSLTESMILWAIAGISAATVRPSAQPESAKIPAFWLIPALSAGGFVLCAVILSVPDHVYAGLSDAVAQKDLTQAERIYSEARDWSLKLPLPGYELFASQQFAALARSMANTPEASKAWAIAAEASSGAEAAGEERFSAAYQSCVLAIANGNMDRAEMEARLSIRLAPNWYRPHAFLAPILQAKGRNAEAESEEKLAIWLRGDIRYR